MNSNKSSSTNSGAEGSRKSTSNPSPSSHTPLRKKRPASKGSVAEWIILAGLAVAIIGLGIYSGSLQYKLVRINGESEGMMMTLDGIADELQNLNEAHRYQSALVEMQRQTMEEQLRLLGSKLDRFKGVSGRKEDTNEQKKLHTARELVMGGKNDSAMTTISKLMEAAPTMLTQYESRMILGNVKARSEDYGAARREYKKAEGIAVLMGRPDLSHEAAEGLVTIDRIRKLRTDAGREERRKLLDTKLERDRSVVEFARTVTDKLQPSYATAGAFLPEDRFDAATVFRLYPDEERMIVDLDSLVETVNVRQALLAVVKKSDPGNISDSLWRISLSEASLIQSAVNIERRDDPGIKITTGRSQKAIQEHVSLHATEIQSIFYAYKRNDRSFGGKVTMRFAISERGEIKSVKPVESSWTNGNLGRALEESIANQMKMWRFAAGPADSGDVFGTATYVFPT